MYAIRDATGTVESIPLIVASILSKKLAAGLGALVMDVKVGSGAFLPGREAAAELARSIVEVARGNGLPTSALLTDMDRVLGRTAGNAVEVRESLDHLTGAARDERLLDVTLALSAELLRLGGVETDEDAARAAAERALASGAAAEHFAGMVRGRGSRRPARVARQPSRGGARDNRRGAGGGNDCARRRAGGWARGRGTGGGRTRETDPVDHAVGLTEVAAPGGRRPAAARWRSCTPPTRRRRRAPWLRCAAPTRSARPDRHRTR